METEMAIKAEIEDEESSSVRYTDENNIGKQNTFLNN